LKGGGGAAGVEKYGASSASGADFSE